MEAVAASQGAGGQDLCSPLEEEPSRARARLESGAASQGAGDRDFLLPLDHDTCEDPLAAGAAFPCGSTPAVLLLEVESAMAPDPVANRWAPSGVGFESSGFRSVSFDQWPRSPGSHPGNTRSIRVRDVLRRVGTRGGALLLYWRLGPFDSDTRLSATRRTTLRRATTVGPQRPRLPQAPLGDEHAVERRFHVGLDAFDLGEQAKVPLGCLQARLGIVSGNGGHVQKRGGHSEILAPR